METPKDASNSSSTGKQQPYDIRDETRSCIRIHDQVVYFKEGKVVDSMDKRISYQHVSSLFVGECFAFDDSFEHEVYNPPLGKDARFGLPRVVLIIDIWHPDLTKEEVT